MQRKKEAGENVMDEILPPTQDDGMQELKKAVTPGTPDAHLVALLTEYKDRARELSVLYLYIPFFIPYSCFFFW